MLGGISTQFGVGRRVARERDTDRDGVTDKLDRCPTVAGPDANRGCPYLDADGDSLNDDVDGCPMVAGPADNKGCPWPDSDRDSVLDKADRCPNEAGPAQNDGCPWPDTDGDKVVDVDDKCPSVPGLVQFGGCPDADNDGVPEPPDLCPAVAGTADNDGCPRYKQIVVTQKQIELSQKIFFAFGKATILPKSDGLLADVVQAFKDYPGLKIHIEGHTDSKGSLKANMKLSQTRADAVKQYLIDHGVAAERITSAKGYGPTQPPRHQRHGRRPRAQPARRVRRRRPRRGHEVAPPTQYSVRWRRDGETLTSSDRRRTPETSSRRPSGLTSQARRSSCACRPIGDVAARMGLGVRSLQRHLREVGTTFRAELTNARLHASQAMLINTDDKVEAIATELGFQSRSAFTLSFRIALGETPAAFRRRRRAPSPPRRRSL